MLSDAISELRVVKSRAQSFTAAEERTQVGLIPDVVDDEEAGAVFELLAELECGVIFTGESGAFAGERRVGRDEAAHDVGILAEGDPEDAIIEVLDDVFVVTERCRESGFSEACLRRKERS